MIEERFQTVVSNEEHTQQSPWFSCFELRRIGSLVVLHRDLVEYTSIPNIDKGEASSNLVAFPSTLSKYLCLMSDPRP
jgi:hypothetical protein